MWASAPANFLLHKYCKKCNMRFLPCVDGRFLFSCHQVDSMFCVCARVVGSTKFIVWFTVKWLQFFCSGSQYAFQQSVITVERLSTCSSIIDMRVEVSRLFSGQSATKISPVSLHIPPSTHWPSTTLPRLYFRLPNFDSLMSTLQFTPPILLVECRISASSWISRR